MVFAVIVGMPTIPCGYFGIAKLEYFLANKVTTEKKNEILSFTLWDFISQNLAF